MRSGSWSPEDSARFNEAAAEEPRKFPRHYPETAGHTARFNEAAAEEPRKLTPCASRPCRRRRFNEAVAEEPRK